MNLPKIEILLVSLLTPPTMFHLSNPRPIQLKRRSGGLRNGLQKNMLRILPPKQLQAKPTARASRARRARGRVKILRMIPPARSNNKFPIHLSQSLLRSWLNAER